MSGLEVIGVISGVVTILDAIVRIHGVARENHRLPPAYDDITHRVALVRETLSAVESRLKKDTEDSETYKSVELTLKTCKKKANRLLGLYEEVSAPYGTGVAKRYMLAARAVRRRSEAEHLTKDLLLDVQLLTGHHVIKSATEAQVARLAEAIEEASSPPPAEDRVVAEFRNYGSGPQTIQTGNGSQYNNTGSGCQFNGTFEGPFYFGPMR